MLIFRPLCYLTTLLHYTHTLPPSRNLTRFVRPELLHSNNLFFLFLASLLACFW
ncbi:hypothetical protein LINPERHAP2_LOCUS27736 [Linum perenne]